MNEEWYKRPKNLVDMFEDTVKKYGKRNWIGTKNAEGEYEWVTYKEAAKRVDNLRAGLAQIGVGKDDVVGIIINNCLEWAIIAFATYGLNARLVPMYEKELEKVWKYIIKDSSVKVLFVVNEEVNDKIKKFASEADSLKEIYVIRGKGDKTMAALESVGAKNPIKSVKPDHKDIATLIYTSGTTGDPKGVLLSHGNFTSNVRAALAMVPSFSEKEVGLAILPWAHSFGQVAQLYMDVLSGASCGIFDSLETLGEDLLKLQPTIFITVPRVFNLLYAKVHAGIKEQGPKKEHLFNGALETAAKLRNGEKVGKKDKLIMGVVFKKIRARVGGKVRMAVTGSAVMNPEIAQFFIDVGIPTFDCYGMTETTPAMTMNSPMGTKLGSVGKAIQDVTVVIDKTLTGKDSEDGEIICYGPNVMQGYHNKPDKDAEIFVEDPKLGRGVRTGDRGRLDEEGYLFITGRFKEEYKLVNGKYVHPASIEEDMKLNPLIANSMVYGAGKDFNVCLVVPNFELLEGYLKGKGIAAKSPKEMVQDKEIQGMLTNIITERLKKGFGGYEIPKKFIFIEEDFTVENGYATQTMKLKRRNVLETYGDQLNALY